MKASSKRRAFLIIVTVIVAVFMLSTSALGQCSMCRTALAGANNALFVRNFNIGVLVLLVPPVTIFCSIFVVLKRYRNSDDEPDE
jgi:hypothetical protein